MIYDDWESPRPPSSKAIARHIFVGFPAQRRRHALVGRPRSMREDAAALFGHFRSALSEEISYYIVALDRPGIIAERDVDFSSSALKLYYQAQFSGVENDAWANLISASLLRPRSNFAVDLYRAQARQFEFESDRQRNAQLLVEAYENRELAAALMESDWLGMELLLLVADRAQGCTFSELCREAANRVDEIASVLARLVRFGALDVTGRSFLCSERGAIFAQRFAEMPSATAE